MQIIQHHGRRQYRNIGNKYFEKCGVKQSNSKITNYCSIL